MNILETILAKKKLEIREAMQKYPVEYLEQSPYFSRTTSSLRAKFEQALTPQIIAEFKRQSPSKGIINKDANVQDVVTAYATNGAAACSILTDRDFFGGTNADISLIRNCTSLPVLRKEFIISEYQILEAKSIGADIVLLIASCLTKAEVRQLAVFAQSLGLEVLLEIHDTEELDHINSAVDFVGVNNRDLKTFEVDLHHSIALHQLIGNDFYTIAESGIRRVEDVMFLHQEGFHGFLIGELFMKNSNPALHFKEFMLQLNKANGKEAN